MKNRIKKHYENADKKPPKIFNETKFVSRSVKKKPL